MATGYWCFFGFVDCVEESLLGTRVEAVGSQCASNLVKASAVAGIHLVEEFTTAVDVGLMRQIVKILVCEDAMTFGRESLRRLFGLLDWRGLRALGRGSL